jgi:hypothetical protein
MLSSPYTRNHVGVSIPKFNIIVIQAYAHGWTNAADKIWRQQQDDIRPGSYLIHRKIVTGPQPAHLFEVPRDYMGSAMPAGGFMEALSGKSDGKPRQQPRRPLKDDGRRQITCHAGVLQSE